MWSAIWVALAIAVVPAQPAPAIPDREGEPRVAWRDSIAVGSPESGRLEDGVRFPAEGRAFFTWDPILRRSPDRDWRRWGADELVRKTLHVLREFRRDHPTAPRVGVGDLSLPTGGYFGPEVGGGIGHATHQNGLDVDVYYPRLDRRERPPESPAEVDLALSQDLLDLFVAAGAVTVYVGPSLPLEGPGDVVVPLVNHDNHLHARFAPRAGAAGYLPLRSVRAPTRASGTRPSRRPRRRVPLRP